MLFLLPPFLSSKRVHEYNKSGSRRNTNKGLAQRCPRREPPLERKREKKGSGDGGGGIHKQTGGGTGGERRRGREQERAREREGESKGGRETRSRQGKGERDLGARQGRRGRAEQMSGSRIPKFRVPAALVSPAALCLIGGICYYFTLDFASEDELNANIQKEFPDVGRLACVLV